MGSAKKLEPIPDIHEVHRSIKKMVDQRGPQDPSVKHFKQVYLGSIALAHGWWQEADLSNSPSAPGFKRILDKAIADYKDIFERNKK